METMHKRLWDSPAWHRLFIKQVALCDATGRRRLPTTSVCAVIIVGSDDQIEQTASMQILLTYAQIAAERHHGA
jgi:hypothetical protein